MKHDFVNILGPFCQDCFNMPKIGWTCYKTVWKTMTIWPIVTSLHRKLCRLLRFCS